MPRHDATHDADGGPIDPVLPDWLVPADLSYYETELGTPVETGRSAIVVAPGATLSRTEAIRLAMDEANSSSTSRSWRLGNWLFLLLWLSASSVLAWLLIRAELQGQWTFGIVFFFLGSGVIVHSEVVEPLLRKLDGRSRAGAFPTTESMIAQSSAAPTGPRARFVDEDIEDAVRAVHGRAPQHDATLRSLVWEWSLDQDEEVLGRIEKLWKQADPESYAKYEADVADD